MNRSYFAFLLCFFVLSPLYAQQVNENFQDGKIWFKLSDDAFYPSSTLTNGNYLDLEMLPFLNEFKAFGITGLSKPFAAAKGSNALQRTFLLEFSAHGQVDELVRTLASHPHVEYAEKVPLDKILYTPNDLNYPSQWALAKVNAAQAWDISLGSTAVTIAIVDDGVQLQHPDLVTNIWSNTGEVAGNGADDDLNGYVDDVNGYDVADNDANPNPPNSSFHHGTAVAGVAGARTGNTSGIASLAFRSKIVAVKATKFANVMTHGYEGILYAAAAGVDIINVSWGGPISTSTGQNVIDFAFNKGCVIVAAAGNNSNSNLVYPAAYNNVLSVAATNSADVKASSSSYGGWVYLSAPGENIYTTLFGNTYGSRSGTSLAAAHVSSLCALIKAVNNTLPNTAVTNCVLQNTVGIDGLNPNYSGQLGTGRINAHAALLCAQAAANQPPIASFSENVTIVPEGGTITFTNHSTYTPVTWNWVFNGGTPSTFNGQSPPPILYTTAGNYTVELTVTNANGSNTMTKTNHISVNSSTGCDTISNTLPGDTVYTWTLGSSGYVAGHNSLNINKWAEFYNNYAPGTHVMGGVFNFVRGKTNNANSTINVQMWDATGPNGAPGAVQATKSVRIKDIAANILPNGYIPTEVLFDTPVTITGNFFIGISITSSPGDTVAIALTQNLINDPRPNSAWAEYFGTWNGLDNIFTGNPEMAMFISPLVTTLPVVADFTPLTPAICAGDTVQFTGIPTTNATYYQWRVQGSVEPVVNGPSANVFFHSGGNHNVSLRAYNSCGFPNQKTTVATVTPKPSIAVLANPTPVICSGTSATLYASGASSFSWYPATGLDTAGGPVVVATPTSPTTYEVTGTQNGCTGSSLFHLNVLPLPNVVASLSDSAPCPAYRTYFDASPSSHVTSFAWTFPGGTPASSVAASDSVHYSTVGPKTATLIASNVCGSDTVEFEFDVVYCASVNEHNPDGFQVYFAPESDAVHLLTGTLFHATSGEITLLDLTGKVLHSRQVELAPGTNRLSTDVSNYPEGVYIIRYASDSSHYNGRFVKY